MTELRPCGIGGHASYSTARMSTSPQSGTGKANPRLTEGHWDAYAQTPPLPDKSMGMLSAVHAASPAVTQPENHMLTWSFTPLADASVGCLDGTQHCK